MHLMAPSLSLGARLLQEFVALSWHGTEEGDSELVIHSPTRSRI
jgi:hypothetical protein